MPDVEQQVRACKDRIAAAQRGQAEHAHAEQVALARVQEAVAALREEYGVNSMDEARDALAALREQRDAELARVEAELAKTEEAG